MAEPVASEAARELYDALGPAFSDGDEDREWAMLKFCIALTTGSTSLIHEWVTDTETQLGWQILLDPANAPEAVLPWLAQFDGAVLTPEMSVEEQRDAIRNPQAFGRGTVAAIEAVAKRRLTGTKSVVVEERYTGDAWRLRIVTLEAETPEPEETRADIIREQKPIGIVLLFNERVPWNWKELREEAATNTWLKVREQFSTWFDVRTHEP